MESRGTLHVIGVLALAVLLPGPAFGDFGRLGSPPHCGVNCMYAALRYLDRDIEYGALVQTKYIGSEEGSSLEELEGAAADFGLHFATYQNLTRADLKRLDVPCILPVKRSVGSRENDHYVLYLPSNGAAALVYDPPNPPSPIPFADLARLWSGHALVLSDRPIPAAWSLFPSRMYFASVAGVALIGLFAAKRFVQARPVVPRTAWRGALAVQISLLLVVTAGLSAIVHRADAKGFWNSAGEVGKVQSANYETFLPKVGLSELPSRLAEGAFLIDARFADDFEHGAIEGAVNIPVDSSDAFLSHAIERVALDRAIVLYCQSDSCPFAARVAERLAGMGYGRMSLYKGGWNEWNEAHGANTE